MERKLPCLLGIIISITTTVPSQELGIFSLGFGSMAIKMANPCSSSMSLGMKSSKVAGKGWADLPRGRESLWEEKDKDPEPFLLMLASKYLEWFGVVTKRMGTSP